MSEVAYRIKRPEVIDEHFEDEYIVVNLKTGSYYSLNRGGSVIWDALAIPATIDEITNYVSRVYSGEPDVLREQIANFLGEMETEALVAPQAASQNGHAAPTATPPPTPLGPFPAPILEKYTDMQALLVLDPIHQVDETGWPSKLPNAD